MHHTYKYKIGFWVAARLLGVLDYKGGGLLERIYCNGNFVRGDLEQKKSFQALVWYANTTTYVSPLH